MAAFDHRHDYLAGKDRFQIGRSLQGCRAGCLEPDDGAAFRHCGARV